MYTVYILYQGKTKFKKKYINGIEDLLKVFDAKDIENKELLIKTLSHGDRAYVYADSYEEDNSEIYLRWDCSEDAANLNMLLRAEEI